MSARQRVQLKVNGRPVSAEVPAGQLLVDFLRETQDLTGTKEACGIGVCGLCTVIVDGAIVSSCLLPVACAQESDVWTIEGITALHESGQPLPEDAPDAALMREVQAAFLDAEGYQCGICTSGQVMAAYALLREQPQPTEEEIRHYMAGNLCRCTGYQSIVRSIKLAAERRTAHGGTL